MNINICMLIMSFFLISADMLDSTAYKNAYLEANTKRISITFIGDIMVHTDQHKSTYNQQTNTYNFNPWFEYIKPYFESTDLLMGNLETTLTNNRSHISGYPLFRSPSQLADALKNTGFDILGTANNHSLDNHQNGVEMTLDKLRELNIHSTGTYKQNEEPCPLIIEKNGIKLGIIASTYGTNGIPLPKDYPHMVNITSEALYDAQISYLKKHNVDGIIAFIHWGYEYKRKAHPDQINMAKMLASKGVNWIIGSHPHAIQPEDYIEYNDERIYVVYSLGNAISNQQWRYSDTGLALTLHISKAPDEKVKTDKISYLPFWIDKFDENNKIDYRIIPLLNIPKLVRLSESDHIKMHEALQDFYELYPHANVEIPK